MPLGKYEIDPRRSREWGAGVLDGTRDRADGLLAVIDCLVTRSRPGTIWGQCRARTPARTRSCSPSPRWSPRPSPCSTAATCAPCSPTSFVAPARPELAADLAAETFAAALAGASRYRAEGDSARGWLFGIAGHKLADSARAGRVADEARRALGLPPRDLDDHELERAEEIADARRLAASLDLLVADLPEDQRRSVLARIVDERDYADIAAEMSCSQAVVRQRVSRGLVALREGLARPR